MFTVLLSPLWQTFAATCDKPTFFGLVPWYQYLTLKTDPITKACTITNFDDASKVLGVHSSFLLIIMAILDDLIRVTALLAVGYVIYGGIQYVTSQGSPDSTRKAQQTIINALIGVVVAILAASIVGFIGSKLGS